MPAAGTASGGGSGKDARRTRLRRVFGAYVHGIKTPRAFLQHERTQYKDDADPGLINVSAYTVLSGLTLLSVHHALQSLMPQRRYLVTDVYFLSWWLLMLGTALCHIGVWDRCVPTFWPAGVTALVVYRLAEILSRELWIVMYRDIPLTSFSRVLSVAFVNYTTIAGLFGYLYGADVDGYVTAMTICLSFSPTSQTHSLALQFFQGAYCFTFIAIILAVFVGRIRLKEDDTKTPSDTTAASNGGAEPEKRPEGS